MQRARRRHCSDSFGDEMREGMRWTLTYASQRVPAATERSPVFCGLDETGTPSVADGRSS
jgi:hypothetical protein